MRQLVLVILCAVASQFCHSEDLRVSTFPEKFLYYRYEDGHIVDRKSVRRGDRVYDALLSFLRRHRANWTTDFNTYAPLLYFRSGYLTVNCTKHVVVVNYRDKDSDRWR